MRRTTPARVPPRPATLAFEPLESRELLAADGAPDCGLPCVFPVADDVAWTCEDSWVAVDPTGVPAGIPPGSEGSWDGVRWGDEASFDVAYATGFDFVDPAELGGVDEPGEVTVAWEMDPGWLFESFTARDDDAPVIPFLPPPDAFEAVMTPIAVMLDALPAAADVVGADYERDDVVLGVVLGVAAADGQSDVPADVAPRTTSGTAARPAAATADTGRSTGWGAFAFQAVGGRMGSADGTATGGPFEGQPGSGRPRLRLPFRPVA